VTPTCNTEPVTIDLYVVTALGIVLAELVGNSREHASPEVRAL
jgi:two-component sensor histidine kinase